MRRPRIGRDQSRWNRDSVNEDMYCEHNRRLRPLCLCKVAGMARSLYRPSVPGGYGDPPYGRVKAYVQLTLLTEKWGSDNVTRPLKKAPFRLISVSGGTSRQYRRGSKSGIFDLNSIEIKHFSKVSCRSKNQKGNQRE